MSERTSFEPGSFRDRHARVFLSNAGVYRGLSTLAAEQFRRLSQTDFFRKEVSGGSIVETEPVERADLPEELAASPFDSFLRHERIPVISYPYEWSFGMLRDAALLHLRLLDSALAEGMILKDGSAYNVQWRGVKPVFIDVSSFESLSPGEPWAGYRQFCQLFLFPLMLACYRGLPLHALLRGRVDGIEPRACWNAMSVRDLLRRGVFSHVFLHVKLQNAVSERRNVKAGLQQAGFQKDLIRANVAGLAKIIDRFAPPANRSQWVDYEHRNTYSEADRVAKERFVAAAIGQRLPRTVWDLGSNTGAYARIAAASADYVLAMDSDSASVDRMYESLKKDGPRNMLPLVADIVDPSPAMGWRLRERQPLGQRSKPDLVLCLALIHHIVIGANVPLREFIEWLAELGADLVIEFVAKSDPMVQSLLRNKHDVYDDYDIQLFERWMGEAFDVVRREPLTGGMRTLYHGKPRPR